MTTELIERPLAKPVILYSVTDETIATMADRFAALRIDGIDDREGYEVVQKARMECVKARSAIEKTRKELKAESLEFGRKVDSEAKRLTALVEGIEQPLLAQQEAVEVAKEKIRKEREDKVYAERQAAWDAVDGPKTDRAYLLSHTDDQFAARLEQQAEAQRLRKEAEAKAETERIERERVAAELAEKNRIEAERLAAERAELERQRKEQADKEAALKAEADRLAKIERDRLEAERLEKAKAKAAEKARIETEARLKRETEAAEQKRLADEAAAKRAEALKPTQDKLIDFAAKVQFLTLPEGLSDDLCDQVNHHLLAAADAIRKIAKGLK